MEFVIMPFNHSAWEHVPVTVVNGITESGCVDYSQGQIDSILLQKSLALFDLHATFNCKHKRTAQQEKERGTQTKKEIRLVL